MLSLLMKLSTLQMLWEYGFFLILPRVIEGRNQGASSIVVPKSTPSNAVFIPANFLGLGFESGFLPYYNNNFPHNVVTSIQARMSQPLVIRVGGTSGVTLTFHSHQKDASHCTSDNCNSVQWISKTGYPPDTHVYSPGDPLWRLVWIAVVLDSLTTNDTAPCIRKGAPSSQN